MPQAVIDIGTNTIILLIGTPLRKSIKVIHDEAVICRLGQALSENHFFLPEAMKRTVEVLKKFKATCEEKKVEKIIAVGTAAFRQAANADVFVQTIKKECGFKPSVLSGEEEAEVVFLAALHDFGPEQKKLIVVDIGGGSTEIITGPIKGKNRPESVISLPLGSVLLTETYVHDDPISADDFQRLERGISNSLKDYLDDFYDDDFNPQDYCLVATAGTATTLSAIDQQMAVYKPKAIHGSRLKKKNLQKLIPRLAEKTIKERQKLPGLDPLRADVILAGALLLHAIMSHFKKEETVISDRGLRYGIFYKKFMK